MAAKNLTKWLKTVYFGENLVFKGLRDDGDGGVGGGRAGAPILSEKYVQ